MLEGEGDGQSGGHGFKGRKRGKKKSVPFSYFLLLTHYILVISLFIIFYPNLQLQFEHLLTLEHF
jgi:hypothetical protein